MSDYARDVGITFTASDKLSAAVRQMSSQVRQMGGDVAGLKQIQDRTFGEQVKVKMNITDAKSKISELERTYKSQAREITRLQSVNLDTDDAKKELAELLTAHEKVSEEIESQNYNLLKQQEEYKRLSKTVGEARTRENKILNEQARRNEQYNSSSAYNYMGGSNMLGSLAKAGLGAMIGNSIGSLADQQISSMFGSTAGSAISGAISSTITGAAIGSVIPVVGTAVGAGVGALVGGINAATTYQKRNDEMFQSYVSDVYQSIETERNRMYEAGPALYAETEKMKINLGTLLKDDERGKALFNDVKLFSDMTPFKKDALLAQAQTLLQYNVSEDVLMKRIKMLGDVSMGDAEKLNGIGYAYAQVQGLGRHTMQDNKQMANWGFNPLAVLAEEMGVTIGYMEDLTSRGLVSADDITRAFEIATSEGGQFHNAMDKLKDTFSGLSSTMEGYMDNLDNAYGEGYADTAKEYQQRMIEKLSSEEGIRLERASYLEGKAKAMLDLGYEEMKLDAEIEMWSTADGLQALLDGDAVKVAEMRGEAMATAHSDYVNSKLYIAMKESEINLMKSIQQDVDINSAYFQTGKLAKEQWSKGWASVKSVAHTSIADIADYNLPSANGFATGLSRVPYDGFPAILHEGERVLTKNQTDIAESAQGAAPVINITINTQASSADDIVDELVAKLKSALLSYGGK